MRRLPRRALGTGLLTAIAYAGWRAWRSHVPDTPRAVDWESAPFPFPPVPRPHATASAPAPAPTPSAPPAADGSCPPAYPVKGKLTSGIYHEPGAGNYERTKPDRCYVDAHAAEADGLRRALR